MNLVDRGGVEVLERAACLELLASEVVGRVGIIAGGAPLVLPVNYGMDHEAVVFRTGPGSKLGAARGSAACFEIDGFDRATRSGWSVIVRGHLREVTNYDGVVLDRVHELADPWLGGDRSHVVRLESTSITGRRVRGSAE